MNQITLTNIPFQPDIPLLMAKLRIKDGSNYQKSLLALVQQAQTIARPKALYKVAPVQERTGNTVVIQGVTFTSRVLQVNLAQTHRVFVFVATGGVELDEWVQSIDDILYNYWADAIAEMALRAAIDALRSHILNRYRPGHLAVMHPGSLADWPIKQQRPLFDLLDNPEAAIGVKLLNSLLMTPTKSVSGIYFPTQESFESCQLCPMENCPNRKAPYDATLYRRKYAAANEL